MLKIKEFREKKGLTQQELANLVGVDRVTIARYENENRSPNHEILLKLSLELDTTPNELLGFNEAYEKYTKYLMSFEKGKDPS